MASLVHTSSPMFNIIRNSSNECIEKVKESAASSSLLPNLAALTTQQQQQLFSLLYKVKNFSYSLKDILTYAFNTLLSPSFNLSTGEEDKNPNDHAVTVLEVLKSLVGSIRRFTDDSLESIGREASETLIAVTHQMQRLEKELDEAKVSARFYNAIFSALLMAFAVLVAPVSTLAVAPFLERFDLFWEDVMEKPIVDKLKGFQAVLINIHSAIALAGKIQDSVNCLSTRVTDPPLYASVVSIGDHIKFIEFEDVIDQFKDDMDEGGGLFFGKFLGVGDVTKRLMEMEKVVADTMTQVAMAEHELEQLIQTLMPLNME